jgi:hypothetical protein
MKLKATAYLRIAAEDWRKKYDKVFNFRDGLAEVSLNGKYSSSKASPGSDSTASGATSTPKAR